MRPLLKYVNNRALALAFCSALISAYSVAVPSPPAKNSRQLADSMEKKIVALKENGAKERPEKRTTVFSQDEVNAYFAERRVKMPDGVRTVTFELTPDNVRSRARIDFDDITRARRSNNPLMYLFTGVHDVEVTARTSGAGAGRVHVAVQTVMIDGVSVPRIALQFFVDRFVNPKYPSVGLDRDYRLPVKMDSVVIGQRQGTVTQK